MPAAPWSDLPSFGTYDVVVDGGGFAGFGAACAAAATGAKTLLVEKYGFLGGATVAQLVSVVLGTNAVDFQGVWHAWARRLLARQQMTPPIRWGSREEAMRAESTPCAAAPTWGGGGSRPRHHHSVPKVRPNKGRGFSPGTPTKKNVSVLEGRGGISDHGTIAPRPNRSSCDREEEAVGIRKRWRRGWGRWAGDRARGGLRMRLPEGVARWHHSGVRTP